MATSAPLDPKASGLGRRRTIVLTTVVGIGALLVGTAVVNRAAGTSRAANSETSGTQPVAVRFPAPSASANTRPRVSVPKPTVPRTTTTLAGPGTTAGFDFVVTPPASGPDPTVPPETEPATTTTATPTTVVGTAVTATLPPPPPPPPPFGAKSLTWTAPRTLTIPAGGTAPLSVLAYNPTGRSVSLSHPLSCTPRLDHGEVCADVVQLIGSHRSAGAHYTIDATGVVAGSYTLTIEGVLTVNVTVS